MRPVHGVTKKGKKGQKLSCVELAICPDHPRRHRPLKFCIRGRVRGGVIYFKFHENRSRGLRSVEGRKSPSHIDKAHGLYNSLYYRTSRDQRNTVTKAAVAIRRLMRFLQNHLLAAPNVDKCRWPLLLSSPPLLVPACQTSSRQYGAHSYEQQVGGNFPFLY